MLQPLGIGHARLRRVHAIHPQMAVLKRIPLPGRVRLAAARISSAVLITENFIATLLPSANLAWQESGYVNLGSHRSPAG